MSTASSHLTLRRGAELKTLFQIEAPIGTAGAVVPVDLTQVGVVLEWIAKDFVAEPVPKMRKTLAVSPGGIELVPGQGKCLLLIKPADTLIFPNQYRQLFWELRVSFPPGSPGGEGPFTVDTGDVEIFDSVFP